MAAGKIFRYEPSKGYGFIKPAEGGPDVFLHVSQLAHGEDPNRLQRDVHVTFQVTEDHRGLKATQVHLEAQGDEDDEMCDVLTVAEFDARVLALTQKLHQEFLDMARAHGWVA